MLFSNRLTSGLSPLARGTRPPQPAPVLQKRFIPAGAGNSFKTAAREPDLAVYPRWRGELSIVLCLFFNSAGLSPLARGTRGVFMLKHQI